MSIDGGLYWPVLIWVGIVVGGMILSAVVVGWIGKRKAIKQGRYCKQCGLWDEPVEVLIHRINEHWKG